MSRYQGSKLLLTAIRSAGFIVRYCLTHCHGGTVTEQAASLIERETGSLIESRRIVEQLTTDEEDALVIAVDTDEDQYWVVTGERGVSHIDARSASLQKMCCRPTYAPNHEILSAVTTRVPRPAGTDHRLTDNMWSMLDFAVYGADGPLLLADRRGRNSEERGRHVPRPYPRYVAAVQIGSLLAVLLRIGLSFSIVGSLAGKTFPSRTGRRIPPRSTRIVSATSRLPFRQSFGN